MDTIVAKVQGVPGDDRCVLLLGYEEQMQEMMRKANPGLARRFQLQVGLTGQPSWLRVFGTESAHSPSVLACVPHPASDCGDR